MRKEQESLQGREGGTEGVKEEVEGEGNRWRTGRNNHIS